MEAKKQIPFSSNVEALYEYSRRVFGWDYFRVSELLHMLDATVLGKRRRLTHRDCATLDMYIKYRNKRPATSRSRVRKRDGWV